MMELNLLTPDKMRLVEVMMFGHIKGNYKEGRGSHFTRSHVEKTRGNGH